MRYRALTAACVLLAALAGPLRADSVEPTQVLGMGLKSAITMFGLPQNMFTVRGSQDDRDDVVFYYPDHMYLFWFKDRVWQVRFDRRATVVVHGISLGMTRSEVQAVVKERPLVEQGDSLYFDLQTEDFPVRVRVAFGGSTVTDLYVYRSDF